MSHLKHGKASGEDGITTDMASHFGGKVAIDPVQQLCIVPHNPNIRKRARVVAPLKDSTSQRSYRPLSLLCIHYKLYESMILARIHATVDEHLQLTKLALHQARY